MGFKYGPSLPTEQTRAVIKDDQTGKSTCHHYHEARWCSLAAQGCPAPAFRGMWVLLCGGQRCRLSGLSQPLYSGMCWYMSFNEGSPCLCVPDCGICPAIKQDVHLFFHRTSEEYVEYVKQYKDDPEILENTEKIKKCVDSTLTDEDKTHATAFIVSLYVSG